MYSSFLLPDVVYAHPADQRADLERWFAEVRRDHPFAAMSKADILAALRETREQAWNERYVNPRRYIPVGRLTQFTLTTFPTRIGVAHQIAGDNTDTGAEGTAPQRSPGTGRGRVPSG